MRNGNYLLTRVALFLIRINYFLIELFKCTLSQIFLNTNSRTTNLGVRGVPFFLFNRKYAVSDAQESSSFLQALEKSFTEWEKENPVL